MTKDRTTGLASLAIGSIYCLSTFRVPIFEAGDDVGPRAFPFLVASVVLVCGILLLIRDFRTAHRKPFSWGFAEDRRVWMWILLTIAGGIVYGLVLDWLGYLIATFLFMAFVTFFINGGKHLENLIIAASFAVVSFVVFAVILKLSLPRGLLSVILSF
ncbi:MAG: tripartite tricarboxylate transporter TctB family protein [Deltaproteobacteria bacterium]|nr:tripartite tricarboxylate transporter TctB family protein [Deltaproteobacteria bacterium]